MNRKQKPDKKYREEMIEAFYPSKQQRIWYPLQGSAQLIDGIIQRAQNQSADQAVQAFGERLRKRVREEKLTIPNKIKFTNVIDSELNSPTERR